MLITHLKIKDTIIKSEDFYKYNDEISNLNIWFKFNINGKSRWFKNLRINKNYDIFKKSRIQQPFNIGDIIVWKHFTLHASGKNETKNH